jgi:hypothetical protein
MQIRTPSGATADDSASASRGARTTRYKQYARDTLKQIWWRQAARVAALIPQLGWRIACCRGPKLAASQGLRRNTACALPTPRRPTDGPARRRKTNIPSAPHHQHCQRAPPTNKHSHPHTKTSSTPPTLAVCWRRAGNPKRASPRGRAFRDPRRSSSREHVLVLRRASQRKR